MEKQKTKTKVKYDLWFLIVLLILLWSLVRQLFELCGILPYDIANFSLWLKIVANAIATFGVLWVTRMYIMNTKLQARRQDKIAKEIEKHPELESIIKDIMRGG